MTEASNPAAGSCTYSMLDDVYLGPYIVICNSQRAKDRSKQLENLILHLFQHTLP